MNPDNASRRERSLLPSAAPGMELTAKSLALTALFLLMVLSSVLFMTQLRADSAPLLRVESATSLPAQDLPLSHPATISVAELARLMGTLEYRERGLLGRSGRQPVFSAEEIAALSPELTGSLLRAQPSEQVRFASFSRRSGALSQLLRTEGIAFVDAEGDLNLAFAGIHEFAGPDEDFFAFLQLSDRDPIRIERNLLRLDSATADWSTRSDRPLWAQASLTGTATAAASRPVEQSSETTTASEMRPGPSELPARAESAPGRQSLEAEVRQRLEFLRGLYEDGLISEPEYEQQRREALQRLNP